MLLCKESMFSEAQTIAAADYHNGDVTDSTNTLDWKSHGDDIDKVLRLFVLNTQAATSAGAATLTVKLLTSADGTNWTTIRTWTAFTLAQIAVAGSFLLNNEPLPDGLLKYVKLTYTVGGADLTGSPKLTAGITDNSHFVKR